MLSKEVANLKDRNPDTFKKLKEKVKYYGNTNYSLITIAQYLSERFEIEILVKDVDELLKNEQKEIKLQLRYDYHYI